MLLIASTKSIAKVKNSSFSTFWIERSVLSNLVLCEFYKYTFLCYSMQSIFVFVSKCPSHFALDGNNRIVLPQEEHTQEHETQTRENERVQKVSNAYQPHCSDKYICYGNPTGSH